MNYLNTQDLQESYVMDAVKREFDLADTLDVKASILLAVIAFLATEFDRFFPSPLSGLAFILRCGLIIFLVFGAAFAIWELLPREYGAEVSPQKYSEWMEGMRQRHGDAIALEKAAASRIKRAVERAERYIEINRGKIFCLDVSFYCTSIALMAGLAALVIRLF